MKIILILYILIQLSVSIDSGLCRAKLSLEDFKNNKTLKISENDIYNLLLNRLNSRFPDSSLAIEYYCGSGEIGTLVAYKDARAVYFFNRFPPEIAYRIISETLLDKGCRKCCCVSLESYEFKIDGGNSGVNDFIPSTSYCFHRYFIHFILPQTDGKICLQRRCIDYFEVIPDACNESAIYIDIARKSQKLRDIIINEPGSVLTDDEFRQKLMTVSMAAISPDINKISAVLSEFSDIISKKREMKKNMIKILIIAIAILILISGWILHHERKKRVKEL